MHFSFLFTGFVAAVLLSDSFLEQTFDEINFPLIEAGTMTSNKTIEGTLRKRHSCNELVFAPEGGVVLTSTSLEEHREFDAFRDVTVEFTSDCGFTGCNKVQILEDVWSRCTDNPVHVQYTVHVYMQVHVLR